MKEITKSMLLIFIAGLQINCVNGQGQRCEAPSDCTSEYAPFCSKWGWCVWTELYGEEGPPQSKGAEEDGERGQCRDDNDCTKWAPICSPLGYCRSGFWDGSFGAPSNPRPGQEPSQWIKDNAAKFRTGTKENPNPNNVNTGNKADRKTGQSAQAGSRQGSNGSRKQGPRGGAGSRRGSESPRGGGANNSQYQDQINKGQIPGVAGKDYPTNSISSVRNKYPGIKAAPKDKIPQNYPSGNQSPRRNGQNKKKQQGQSGQNRGGAGGCPGNLEDCMAACPSNIKVFQACVASCGRRCRRK